MHIKEVSFHNPIGPQESGYNLTKKDLLDEDRQTLERFRKTGKPEDFAPLDERFKKFYEIIKDRSGDRHFNGPKAIEEIIEKARNNRVFVIGSIGGRLFTYSDVPDKTYGRGVPFPQILYGYEIGGKIVYLDIREFQGRKGNPVLGLRSQSNRSGCVITGNAIIEQKGIAHSIYSPRLHDATYTPIGVLPLDDAIAEHENATMAEDYLPYKTEVHDLGIDVESDSPFSEEKKRRVHLGILERSGKIGEFAPNIRIPTVLRSNKIIHFFEKFGWSIDRTYYNAGFQLGKLHEAGVFHIFPHAGNIDMFGNHVDFENSPNTKTMDFFAQEVLRYVSSSNEFSLVKENAEYVLEQQRRKIFFEAKGLGNLISSTDSTMGGENLATYAGWMVRDKKIEYKDAADLILTCMRGYINSRLGNGISVQLADKILSQNLYEGIDPRFIIDILEKIEKTRSGISVDNLMRLNSSLITKATSLSSS